MLVGAAIKGDVGREGEFQRENLLGFRLLLVLGVGLPLGKREVVIIVKLVFLQ